MLQGRAVQRGPGKRPIVIAAGDLAPALVRLTLDVGLAGFALGIQRVELQVKVMFGGFPGVDRAPEELLAGLSMGSPLRLILRWSGPRSARVYALKVRRDLRRFGLLGSGSRAIRSPKKRGPFHVVPVMA